ncbi:dihydroxyacetone kinase family protein [Cryptosporangium sp. NPDC051539]|uniref:dihydroxyacetone kinase family protein n=1 Tax=Cryptosporangium sp. NPDC051539 TaxID=3363962 RepID=UPI0037BD2861
MTYVFNRERTFKDEMIDGLVTAYSRYQRRIPATSGVVSVSAPVPGRVSTIVGGGSGHYPSFAGLVGPGFADAAVCGDIFTSPSAEQVYRTIRAVDGGAGVLMLFGNYAGDVMHFGLAADQARASDRIDARIVLVTDDIASAPPEREHARRGIAGDFFVFRVAAAAAHRGDDLDGVELLARRANTVTRTLGVAFDGCTVPGRTDPLFTVPDGTMSIGLGIHGEPGILSVPRTDADSLARTLVERLLAERPAGADRARILLNGLGRVKYEELFVLYRSLARLLHEAGVGLTEPEVGEFVTSLDMAGCSVTLVWTDDELEELLSAPCASPGYSRPGVVPGLDSPVRPLGFDATVLLATPPTVAEVTAGGALARSALAAVADRLHELESRLGDLDAVAADGDHGTTMTRGIDAAVHAADRAGPSASAVLSAAGMAFADAAGGASGALWGSGLTTLAGFLDGEVSTARLAEAWAAVEAAVTRLGGASPGEKTLVDALHPFVAALRESDLSPAAAWASAAAVAQEAAAGTASLTARRGRASWLADRSVGTEDPGAVSLAESLAAVAGVLP